MFTYDHEASKGDASIVTSEVTPRYYRLKESLLDRISELPPGSAIPTERAISDEYGVSRTTVRRALHDLFIEGRITREQGRGTFIAEPKIVQELTLTGYTEDMIKHGMVPSSRILSIAKTSEDAEAIAALDLPPSSSVLVISRLRLANGVPMAIEVAHFSYERFGRIADLINEDASVYELLDVEFGVRLDHAEETIESAVATPEDAELLRSEVGGPILLLSRNSYDADDNIVEFVRSRYRGDRFRFVAKLTRD